MLADGNTQRLSDRLRLWFGLSTSWSLPVLIGVMFLAVLAGGIGICRRLKQSNQQSVEAKLAAIAQLKMEQIVHWYDDTLGDARLMLESQFLQVAVPEWLANHQPELRDKILAQLGSLQKHGRYHDVVLLDVQGRVLLNVTGETDQFAPDFQKYLTAAFAMHQSVLTDFYIPPETPEPHLEVVAPLFAGGVPIGAVVLRHGARADLFSLLKVLPTLSTSGKATLVRRDGGSVLCLNDLRYHKIGSLKLRIPLSRQEIPVVQAALGKEGIFTGPDCRGVKVIANVRQITTSPWAIVVEIDESEALASWRFTASLLGALTLALLLALGSAMLIVLYNQKQHRLLTKSEMALQESEQLLHESQTVANLGSYAWDVVTGTWKSSEILDEIFGIDAHYERSLASWTALIHPSDRAMMLAYLQNDVLGRGQPFDKRYQIIRRNDHAERWVHGFGQLKIDAHGKPVRMVGTIQDITERKRMEDELRANEATLRAFFDSPGLMRGVVQVTDDNDILHLTDNVVTAKFFGRTVAEMRHKRASEMATPPEIIRLWIAKYTESAQTGQPVSFEYRHEHEKGNRCFRATVSHLAQGLFGSRYAYSVEDVTEHKRVEDALWLHNSALSAAANAIVITDKQGTVLWANPAFAKLTGYAVAEVLGKNPRVLKSGRHDAEFYRQLWATINAGRVWSGELVNKRKDGSLYTEEMTVTPVANEQGEVINFIAIKQDITERKLIENAIRVSEVRYRSLFENMVEGAAYCQMIIEDDQPLDWVYLSVNPAFEQLTGLKNVIGKRVTEVIPGMRENDPELFALYVRVARTGQPERQEFFSVTLNMWFDLSVYSPGQGFFVAVFDVITERKRAEARVRRTNRQLTDALAELRQAQQQIIEQEKLCTLGQLASGVAHDFNNALAPIIGFSELLLKSPEKRTDAALLVKWLQHINIAATDAANVVRQLREFSQQKLAVASEQQLLDFPKLVKQVVDFTQPRWEVEAQATGRTIRVVADLVPVPLIFGEEFAIREMLTNLIFNAVDCMPTGGTITIGVAADGAAVRLWVSDTGTGMTPEVQRRCFEPFFTTKGPQGTGMGLAMVYGIVQRHSGIITVASKPEHGTTFTIRLPLTNH